MNKLNAKIYRIPLMKLNGFAYVCVYPDENFGDQVIVYDMFSKTPKSYSEVDFKSEFCYRLLINGRPKIKNTEGGVFWDLLKNVDSSNLNINTVWKSAASSFLERSSEWSGFQYWTIFSKLKDKGNRDFDGYDEIKDYPIWIHSNYIGITARIEMFWAKKLKIDVELLYEKEIRGSSTYRLYYNEMMNIELSSNSIIID